MRMVLGADRAESEGSPAAGDVLGVAPVEAVAVAEPAARGPGRRGGAAARRVTDVAAIRGPATDPATRPAAGGSSRAGAAPSPVRGERAERDHRQLPES